MDMLSRADEYIAQNHVDHKNRPAFHVTPGVGWLNDPNGFSVYQGQIHLFYQFYPYEARWGAMHWGHQVTDDMICWRELPTALAPDSEYDSEGCFSGSAIEIGKKHVLVYTGVCKKRCEDGSEAEYQNQCIAVGDGRTYKKSEQNPVICGTSLPEGFSRRDFRDPKIWKEEERFYLVAGNKDQDQNGQIVLFSSGDLRNWRYECVLAHSAGKIGRMWECPDFFALDGSYVLICSPQNMRARKYEFHNGHNSLYFLGEYNRTEHSFQKGEPVSLDYGMDFYAPQTTLLPDGRRVMIAWMQSWHTSLIPEGQTWNGMMTLPRELNIVDGRLVQSPVRELEKYRRGMVVYQNQMISGTCSLEGVNGRMIDMTLEIAEGEYTEFRVEAAHNDEYTTSYIYRPGDHTLEADRTYSGIERDVVCRRIMQIADPDTRLKLRFIMDRNSIEVFVNDGRQVSSTVIFTPQEAYEILFSCDGRASVNIVKYEICVGQDENEIS